MELHQPTAAIFTVFTAFACVMGLGLLWLRDRSPYLRDWTLSMVALLCSFALYGIRDVLPSLLGNLLPNIILLLCAQLSYIGYAHMFGRPIHPLRHVSATLGFALLMGLAHHDPQTRMVVGNACLLVLALASLKILLRQRQHVDQRRRLTWPVLGLPLFAHSSVILVAVWRMSYTFAHDASINTAGHSAQVLSQIFGAVGALAGALGYTVLHGDRLRSELEGLARTDGLTGLPNRRAFDERLAEEWQRQRRLDTPLSLLILDVDHFKRLNDELGHATGDDALRRLGQVLGQQVRPYDLAARIGGEEFCLLLPNCSLGEARQCAGRLLTANLQVPVSEGSRRFTLSIGLARARADDSDAQAFMARADAALYRAKQEGRHRCCEVD